MTACGFQPIHATFEQGDERAELLNMLAHIELSGPETREGNVLVAELEDLLNPDNRAPDKRKTGEEGHFMIFYILESYFKC